MTPLKTRRDFLRFMGYSGASLTGLALLNQLACVGTEKQKTQLPFSPLKPSDADQVIFAEGFEHKILIKWGEAISSQHSFGYNNDYIAIIPFKNSSDRAMMWVNHESVHPLFVSGYEGGERTREQVIKEQQNVGGSLVEIRRDQSGTWQVVKNSPYNRSVNGTVKIPIISDRPIEGKKVAIGTLANCAGGVTPWQTVLTCEENYHDFYGEYSYVGDKKVLNEKTMFGWHKFFNYSPEHYGWVVEVNPFTGEAKKLTGLGRFAHECATTVQAADGRTVVYSGDDKGDECLYKFISDKAGSLESGELFVANLEKGEWVSLKRDRQPLLQKKFKDQTEVLIRTREAAHMLGGTPLDRPEDIEQDPHSGSMLVALTNNKRNNNYFGSILKIMEKDNDPLSLKFTHDTFLTGGEKSGFACPDNMAFDRKGNLWITTDMSGSSMNKPPYQSMKNNGLFYVSMSGPHAGQVLQVASAPIDAEFTGPCFSPDGETLFLSVQHPGEKSRTLSALTSHWPEGGNSIPKPAVITISGPTLAKLLS